MNNCYAYVRVSTVKQGDGVSLEAQREAIEHYAKRNNINIIEWFEEKETAAKRGRPVFMRIVRNLKIGKAQGLVMHRIDRSARNFADWATIGDLADSGVEIYFASESLDFKSRGGRLTADIQAVIATDYIRNLREETVKGMYGRLKQGIYPFGAPLGYLNKGGGKPKKPDPVRAPLVRQMFQLYATGEYSLWGLVREMNRLGLTNTKGRPVTKTGIETVLNNPFYTGLMRLRSTGQTFPGAHQAIISTELFQQVQDIKSGKSGKKETKHNQLYRGLFRCGHCANPMSPELQKGNVYYRCHRKECPTKTVREEEITNAVEILLMGLLLDDEQCEKLTEAIGQMQNKPDNSAQIASLGLEKAKLDQRLNALNEKLLDGIIDDNTFLSVKEKLMLDSTRLEEKRQNLQQSEDNPQKLLKFIERSKSLYFQYIYAKPMQKRVLLKMLCSNCVITGRNVVLKPDNWLQDLTFALAVLCGAHDDTTYRTNLRDLMDGVPKELLMDFDKSLQIALEFRKFV